MPARSPISTGCCRSCLTTRRSSSSVNRPSRCRPSLPGSHQNRRRCRCRCRRLAWQ
jgi:hypothetical protein